MEEVLHTSEPCLSCYSMGGYCERDSPEDDCYNCRNKKKKHPCSKVLPSTKPGQYKAKEYQEKMKKDYEEKSQHGCS